jgi:hypothetical protein
MELFRLLLDTLEQTNHLTLGGFAADLADALEEAGYFK